LFRLLGDKLKKAGKKYLTDDEAESLKAACSDADEQAIVRDMLDTGMTLQEALNRRRRIGDT
jgi:integrase